MEKKRKMWRGVALLNPKNLAREVNVYGYHFSWRAHSAWIFGALLGCVMLGVLFQLKWFYILIVSVAVAFALPILILDMYKRMYEQKRFADVVSYMEQMLYSFQKTGKVAASLKETCEIFEDGQMRKCVDEAILHMELGKPRTKEGILWESLAFVEERYGCEKLSMVHQLLAATETYGGAAEESIFLMLEDIEHWKKRVYHLQAEKKKYHTDNVISIVVAVILCAVALYVLEAMQQMFTAVDATDIFSISVIQFSSALFILLLLKILIKSTKSLTDNWLDESKLQESEYLQSSYELVVRYENGDRKNGRRLRDQLGYRLAKKDVTEAMYLALPQWLIHLMLLLQHNNVQVALAKSVEGAPTVLREELILLRERMEMEPAKLQTYTLFCRNFDVPEIGGCMKMLHALSENGTGDMQTQMNQLLVRVWQMQDRADEINNGRIAFQMKMIFSYPVLAATIKLLIDLTIGMAVMMQVLGSVGGV